MKCKVCKAEAVVALSSHNAAFCEKCYLEFFRRQVQRGIEQQKMFDRNDAVLVALSGGKDSLALALELSRLGYNIAALFIDLAIPGSSQAARLKVEAFCAKHGIKLQVMDLSQENLAIPAIKQKIRRPICSVCGKIKRYYFNKAAVDGNFAVLATGHNLDDEVARLSSNTLRWDAAYLSSQGPYLPAANGFAARAKPLWRLSEFETANYAYLRGIDYHCAVCPYSQGASFSVLKRWFHILEREMPGRKLDFYQGFLERGKKAFLPAEREVLAPCENCGFPTASGGLCGICRLKNMLSENSGE